jgi:glycogen debranching enzyme
LMHWAVSATSYQALATRHLVMMARVLGRDDLAEFFATEHRQLGELVNARFWDEAHGLYNDLAADGRFITELSPGSFCKHVHMFWPLLAGIVPPDRVSRLVAELENPASFNRRNGVPSLSADSAGYTGGPSVTGQYWRGAVWPSGQCIVQEGLHACGQDALARRVAEKYFAAQLEVFGKEKTIKENLAPDHLLGCGVREFVGWGGLGPVANLIEAILGFDLDVPGRTITWNVTRTQRHGLKGISFGDFRVDLIAERRAGPAEPCEIQVESGGPFTLKCVVNGRSTEIHATKGSSRYMVRP